MTHEIQPPWNSLLSLALDDYLRRRHQGQMMNRLNHVYGKHPDAAEKTYAGEDKVKVSLGDQGLLVSAIRQAILLGSLSAPGLRDL